MPTSPDPGPDRRHVLAALAAGTALAGLSACTGRSSEPPARQTVVIKASMSDTLRFTPAVITIHPGDAVEWHNDSLLVHTVTADPALAALPASTALPAGAAPFNSGNLQPGAVYRHVFEKPGTYKYFCIPHEAAGMTGTVIVQP